MDGLTPAEIGALDARHHLHPFTHANTLNAEGARIVVGGRGVYLELADGRRVLDGFSGLWNVAVGYGRTEIAEAVHAQMLRLPYYNTFFKSTNPAAVELAALLAELAPPGFRRVFFSNSGSEANDTVIRMVRHYWALQGEPERQVIIARRNAYHGSTMGGASLSGMAWMHAQGGLPIPGIEHIAQPWWWGEGGERSPEAFGVFAAQELDRAIERIGAHRVAAFIAEPIQGAGGVIIPPDSYWPEVQRILRARKILFVSDEVICGFGRTGRWFGCEHFGTEPDLITIAKNVTSGYLPLGGVLVGDRVADVLSAGDFNHGYTTSGHAACCAAAIANLGIIRRERLVERVAEDIGPYLKAGWLRLAEHELVGEARMVGLLGGLELTADKHRRAPFPKPGEAGIICRDAAWRHGLILRATGDTMLAAPPFVLSHAEADEMLAITRRALDDALAALRQRGWM